MFYEILSLRILCHRHTIGIIDQRSPTCRKIYAFRCILSLNVAQCRFNIDCRDDMVAIRICQSCILVFFNILLIIFILQLKYNLPHSLTKSVQRVFKAHLMLNNIFEATYKSVRKKFEIFSGLFNKVPLFLNTPRNLCSRK